MATMDNRFTSLNDIDVSGKVEQKNGLNYLSWAWAWGEFKKLYPDSFYTVYENAQGWPYFTDGKTCWVKTGVTLVDKDYSLELVEMLPVMDFKNQSVPLDGITSTIVNKTIQRSLTKAIARHGLGLFVYAGEDLPEETKKENTRIKDSAIEEVKACVSESDLRKVCDKYRGSAIAKEPAFIKAANDKANEIKNK